MGACFGPLIAHFSPASAGLRSASNGQNRQHNCFPSALVSTHRLALTHTRNHLAGGITKQTFTRASTPSDRRAAAEQLAELRRLDDGVLRAVRAGGDLQAASAQAATEALQKRIGREFDTLEELKNSELVRQQRSLIAALQEEWVATCCA
jgi:hypothetical protein